MTFELAWLAGLSNQSVLRAQRCLGLNFRFEHYTSRKALCESSLRVASSAQPRPSFLLTDIHFSDGNFFDLLASGMTLPAPFFVLSKDQRLESIELAFHWQALDYFLQPFSENLLALKIKRALSLSSRADLRQALSTKISLNAFDSTIAVPHSAPTQLTLKEFRILSLLVHSYPKSLPRSSIYEKIWGSIKVERKTLDVHIFNLRRKLEPLGFEIRYNFDMSYSLVETIALLDGFLAGTGELPKANSSS